MARKLGRGVTRISEKGMEKLLEYSWPGNIRELENVVERSTILSPDPIIEISESLAKNEAVERRPRSLGTLEEVERGHILQVLTETRWAVEGEKGAASILGLKPSTLRGRMRKLGINKEVRGG